MFRSRCNSQFLTQIYHNILTSKPASIIRLTLRNTHYDQLKIQKQTIFFAFSSIQSVTHLNSSFSTIKKVNFDEIPKLKRKLVNWKTNETLNSSFQARFFHSTSKKNTNKKKLIKIFFLMDRKFK